MGGIEVNGLRRTRASHCVVRITIFAHETTDVGPVLGIPAHIGFGVIQSDVMAKLMSNG